MTVRLKQDLAYIPIKSPKVFAQSMAKIAKMLENNEDPLGRYMDEEEAHMMADELMCNLLETLGYGKAVKIFKNMPKWYT